MLYLSGTELPEKGFTQTPIPSLQALLSPPINELLSLLRTLGFPLWTSPLSDRGCACLPRAGRLDLSLLSLSTISSLQAMRILQSLAGIAPYFPIVPPLRAFRLLLLHNLLKLL